MEVSGGSVQINYGSGCGSRRPKNKRSYRSGYGTLLKMQLPENATKKKFKLNAAPFYRFCAVVGFCGVLCIYVG
jgi:hypothetical protein